MSFKLNLSPLVRAQLDLERAEIKRLYTLTDLWLGKALLDHCRTVRKACPGLKSDEIVYDDNFFWHIIPEISYRLGYRNIHKGEVDYELRRLTAYEFRIRLGYYLQNVNKNKFLKMFSWQILLAEPANGNPVVFAIDRICPGRPDDKEDIIARRLNEIAHCRGVEYNGRWTPAYMERPARKFIEFV